MSGLRRISSISRLDRVSKPISGRWARVGRGEGNRKRGGIHGARMFHGTSTSLMSKRDYYEVLGVDRSVDEKELKKKYRQLAKKYHPDQSTEEGATEKFQEITHAYETLSDPEKRQAYDTFGPDYEQAGMGGAGGGGFGGFGGFEGSGFEDFFGGFGQGGGGFGQRQQQDVTRGSDLRVGLNLTFREAAKGCKKTINYRADGECSTCDGSGAKKGEKPDFVTCSECNGQGVTHQLVGGFIQVPTMCAKCHGRGKSIKNACGTCYGSGVEQDVLKTVTIDVPAGVDNGMTMSQRDAGNSGFLGGPAGSLQLEIMVAPDQYFERSGLNVHTKAKLSLVDAILGCTFPVQTLDGEVDLKLTPGVKNGDIRRLRGRGIEHVQQPGAKGDQLVTFSVQMPSSLTDRQKEIIKEFGEIEMDKGK